MSDPCVTRMNEALEALPEVSVNAKAFLVALRKRAAEGELEALNVADLLLAFAALNRDSAALRELDRRVAKAVGLTVGRFDGLQPDELAQQVRNRVLVGDGAAGPRLGRYAGRGTLVSWLKTVATSLAIDESRRARPADESEDELLAAASSEASPEAKLFSAQHKHHFNQAFRQALAKLTPQERTVLKMRFVDQVAIEDVGRAFNVHRTTAMRWLEKAQSQVMATTRAMLRERLGLRGAELDSLMREVQPSIVGRLSRLLAPIED